MVKAKKNNNKNRPKRQASGPKKRPGRSGARTQPGNGLDVGGIKHARMLLDPCNAEMTMSTYAGMGTGQFRRVRKILEIAPTVTEGTYSFTPGTNVFRYWATATPGAAGALIPVSLFSVAELTTQTDTRCIAACVKVRYIGPESNRSGVVALRTAPFSYHVDGETVLASEEISKCQVSNRTGEVLHEVRFVPGIGDETFTPHTSTNFLTRTCGTFGLAFVNVPPGSLQFEVTAILEVEPTSGYVMGIVPPPSRNTTNHVLSALGAPISWAFNHLVVPTIKSVLTPAMQTGISGASVVSNAMKMLTL